MLFGLPGSFQVSTRGSLYATYSRTTCAKALQVLASSSLPRRFAFHTHLVGARLSSEEQLEDPLLDQIVAVWPAFCRGSLRGYGPEDTAEDTKLALQTRFACLSGELGLGTGRSFPEQSAEKRRGAGKRPASSCGSTGVSDHQGGTCGPSHRRCRGCVHHWYTHSSFLRTLFCSLVSDGLNRIRHCLRR